MSQMCAALLYGKEDLRLEDIPVPEIGEGEVLLQTASGSVCGTDIRMLKSGHAFATAEHPLVIGHEMSGVIAKIGGSVPGLGVGQRVCVAPNYNPTSNRYVASGNAHLDPAYRALGIHENGAFAEFVRIPREAVSQGNIFQIPAHVSFADASMVEPLSCVYNAYEKARTLPGDTVLIFGAGPIGMMHAKLSKAVGAGRVIISDRHEERLALARTIIPDLITVNGDPGEELMRITSGYGADVIITACPSGEAQTRAVEIAAINGRIIFFGGLPKGKSMVPLDTNIIHYKQLLVTGTTRQSLAQFQKSLDLIGENVIRVSDLITSVHPIDAVRTAISMASNGRGLKARIAFDL
jgi:L-iditol 2-dehydrogenase